MPRIYTVSFAGTVTAAGGDTDYLEVQPSSGKSVILRGWSIGQTTDIKDAAEEGMRFSIIRLAGATSGSGGSSVTPRPMDSADSASLTLCEVNNTTVATGTEQTLAEYAWINRHSPWDYFFPEDGFCPRISGTDALVFRQQNTLSGDISVACTFWIESDITMPITADAYYVIERDGDVVTLRDGTTVVENTR